MIRKLITTAFLCFLSILNFSCVHSGYYVSESNSSNLELPQITAERWYSYQQKPANCAINPSSHFENGRVSPPACFVWLTKDKEGFYSSTGPWWIDPNHEMVLGGNGYGHVNVIAFYQEQHKNGILDIREAKISFEIKNDSLRMVEANSREGLKQSHIYFWFQTEAREIDNCVKNAQIGENCTRQSNYILTAKDDPTLQFDRRENSGVRTIEPGKYNSEDWTCLKYGRNVKYDDCLPISKALSTIYAMGFLAAPVAECITDKPWQVGGKCDLELNKKYSSLVFNSGTFNFKDFIIENARESISDEP